MIRDLHPSRQEMLSTKTEFHYAYRPDTEADYPQATATNPEYMNHQMIQREHYQGGAYTTHNDLNQTAPVQQPQPHPSQVKPRARSFGGATEQSDRRSERQSWHEQQAALASRPESNNPALRGSRTDISSQAHAALRGSRTDINNQGLAAKPPLPTQRFGPIYQYRSLSRDHLQSRHRDSSVERHRDSSAERRSIERPPSPNKDDNNNNALDSPSSKPSADRDSGYTSTSVSMNRSDSPERLNPAADFPGSFDGADTRRSYIGGEVDPEKTKPLRVYTTANIKPDVRPVSYPSGPQGHHYSAQLPPADHKDNPHGPWQRSAPAPASGLAPTHRGWSQPRTWLEGPRRVTEL